MKERTPGRSRHDELNSSTASALKRLKMNQDSTEKLNLARKRPSKEVK